MSSQCTNDGTYTLTITFKPGIDLNMAQVLVQNRVALAQPILPDLVQRRGVTVKKKSPSVLMIVNLFSHATATAAEEPVFQQLRHDSDPRRIGPACRASATSPISATATTPCASGSIRARWPIARSRPATWSRPSSSRTSRWPPARWGSRRCRTGRSISTPMNTLGRLIEAEQFDDMISRPTQGRHGIVRLSDVAKVELGAQVYDQSCTLDGKPSVALSIYQLPGSNALKVARAVRAKMEELKERFPDGIDYEIVYDTTPFINESINEVFKTLRDAVMLVAMVVLVFLQNWRSAMIPLVAVPVAVIGTFAVMAALGFSLNNLTLFGLVLAIGIVVDDAIVVVEAVEHHIEHGMSPREATILAMDQVSGPVIAVGLVLAAVFVPCAFISGIIGQFFRQFALTIAVSTVISAFNSLTLSPALSALLLKPRDKGTVRAVAAPGFVAGGALAG